MVQMRTLRLFRHAPVITCVLMASLAVVLCVILTAIGSLVRIDMFYNNSGNSTYAVLFPKGMRTSSLSSLVEDESIKANIILISPADVHTGGVAVGISQTRTHTPDNYIDVYIGGTEALKGISNMRGQALLSRYYCDLYNTISPPMETVFIEDMPFEPLGMADYYFDFNEWDWIDASQAGDIEIGIPPMTWSVSGEALHYPDSMASVLISAHDFTRMNLPLAACKVVFYNPPSFQEHQVLTTRFQEIDMQMEEWQTGSQFINLSHINGGLCMLAVLSALTLMCGMVRYLLDACAEDMRAMFIIGCSRGWVFRAALGEFMLLYILALGLSVYPCRQVLNWMRTINATILISLPEQLILSLMGYALVLLISAPTIWRTVCQYTREDGQYVQAY